MAVHRRQETSPTRHPSCSASQRTGPDLTNVGVRQPSAVWQYIHLYNPRAVVPESVMPAFDWMFKVVDQAPPGTTPVPLPKAYAPAHGIVVPDGKAEALVTYLLSLKQPALPGTGSNESGTAMPGMSSTTTASTSTAANGASTAPSAAAAGSVSATGGYDAAKGKALFTANCAACHQANGEGLPGAFPALKGNAAINDADPTTHIRAVLHGLQGANVGGVVYSSPMPAFGDTLSDADVANIIDYERSSWGNHGTPVTAERVAAERAKTK